MIGKKESASMTARVLFVCTGNICRSPTAEAVLRRMAEDAGLGDRIETDSAGLGGWHVGEPPDARAIEAGARRGYDLAPLRARQVARRDFDDFDLLIGLDRGHGRHLTAQRPPESAAQVRLLLDYAPAPARGDVPDPYYGGTAEFEHALDLIEAGTAGLLDAIRRDHL